MNILFTFFIYLLKFAQWLSGRKTLLLCLVLVVVNTVFKYDYIFYHSIWGDESYAIWLSLHPVKNIIADVQKGADAPMYYLILHAWVKIFGIGEAAVKSLSIIFSSVAIAVFFLFVKKLTNHAYAFLAGAIYVTSSMLLHYGIEVRSYSLVVLLTVTSMHFFMCLYMQQNQSRKYITFLALFNFLMFFTHYLTSLLFAVQGLSAIILNRKTNRFFMRWLMSMFLALLFIIPWFIMVYKSVPLGGQSWLQKPDFNEFLKIFAIYCNGWKWFYIFIGFLLLSLVLFLAKPSFKKQEFNYKYFGVLLIWTILPPVILFIYSQFNPAFHSRYILFVVPGLIAGLVYVFFGWKLNSLLKLIIAAAVVVVLYKDQQINQFSNENWRQAMAVIKQEQTPGSVIFVSANYQEGVFSYHYDKNIFRNYTEIHRLLNDRNVYAIRDASEMVFPNKIAPAKVILVQTQHLITDQQNSLADTLGKLYPQQQLHDIFGIKITVYNK